MSDRSLAFNRDWLNSQPREKQAGLLLGAYQERAKLKQEWLAHVIGASTQTLYQWESGKVALPSHKAGLLVQHLQLSDDEAVNFMLLADSAITTNVGKAWLEKQIKQKNWEAVSFPAFDAEWLNAQRQEKRAGLMLRAGRHRKSMSQEELGTLLGSTREAENGWEMGRHVPVNKVGSIIQQLSFSEAEAETFVKLASPAVAKADEQWLHEKLQPDKAAVLDFPALDDAWLNTQRVGARAGLLLRAYREQAHVILDEVAHATGTTKSAVHKWETGDERIPAHKMGTICGMLALNDQEAEKLIFKAHPELLQTTRLDWVRDKIAQKNWQHINHPALDAGWLNKQPVQMKAGMLLRAHRENGNMTQAMLSAVLGLDRDIIGDIERGGRHVSPKRLERLTTALKLTPEEKTYFLEVAEESAHAHHMSKVQTSLGATVTGQQARELSGVETHTRRR